MPEPEPPPPVVPAPRRWPSPKWAALPAAALALAAAWLLFPRSSAPHPPVIRFTLDLDHGDFAVAPDSSAIVYVAPQQEGNRALWLRPLDQSEPRELPGTRGAAKPFWSPDSQHVAFFADRKLKRADVLRGTVMTIADAPGTPTGQWDAQGFILFGSRGSPFMRVPATGGKLEQRKPPADQPMGGYTLTPRGGALLARNQTSGVETPLPFVQTRGTPQFSASESVLAFRDAPERVTRQLLWFDRTGRVLGQLGEPADWGDFTISPDGARLDVTRGGDLWTFDLRRGGSSPVRQRQPAEPVRRTAPRIPSPDGRWTAYTQDGDVFVESLSGNKGRWMVSNGGGSNPVWRRDGRELFYLAPGGLVQAVNLNFEPPQPLFKLPTAGPFAVTPDGRFLAAPPLEQPSNPVQVIVNWTSALR